MLQFLFSDIIKVLSYLGKYTILRFRCKEAAKARR